MPRPYDEIDLSKEKTYSTASGQSNVTTSLEAVPPSAGKNVRDFLNNLSAVLKNDLLMVMKVLEKRQGIIITHNFNEIEAQNVF